jgi:hypothetical protein
VTSGIGNRIAGSLYGSDRIIVIAGANKLVKDLNAGLDRIHFVAAQMNNVKYRNNLALKNHFIITNHFCVSNTIY